MSDGMASAIAAGGITGVVAGLLCCFIPFAVIVITGVCYEVYRYNKR